MGKWLDSAGIEFEDALVEKICEFTIKTYGKNSFQYSTVEQDRKYGTDCFILGVPVDVTLRISEKRRSRISKRRMIIDGLTIEFGIRYGNRYRTFDDPVLLIGIETGIPITEYNIQSIIGSLKDNMYSIIDGGMDAYWTMAEA